jgi:acyl-CoA synthetase (AMP-forming)/AMP-acid ligase II
MKTNLGQVLAKRAELNPRLEALVDVSTGRRFTYAELNAQANRIAHALRGLHVNPGDRVATLLMNGPEFVETFFGAAKIGGVIAALNWRLVADELSFILTDSGAHTLFFGSEFNTVVTDLHARGEGGTRVRTWIHVGEPADRPPFAISYRDWRDAAPAAEPAILAGGDDLLYIMYTSGTTGHPKGVMHSHATTMWAVLTACATADLRFKDRYLICLPLFHVGALNPLLDAFYVGGTSVIMREFHPVKIWEVFQDERIAVSLAVPAMLNFMLQTYDAARYDVSSLRWIMSGASPVPVTLIERYAALGIEIHQVYGLTESGGPACLISPDEAIARAGSTGKAFFHTDVRVVDDAGADVAPNVPGELWVRGPHVMLGYWNRPEATAEAIVDGWLHTGDVAMVDGEGFVYIHDRLKDLIISGGENIYPAEIENAILGHPGVAEVAVIGAPSEKWGESPVAVVVRKDPALTAEDVLGHCAGKLARFKLPKLVHFAAAIPRNPTGKALKRVLREQFPGPAPD